MVLLDDLVEGFLCSLPSPTLRDVWASEPDLPESLTAFCNESRLKWPAIPLTSRAFVAHVARHIPSDVRPREALSSIRGADLFLAAACLSGTAGAFEAFEQTCMKAIPRKLAQMNLSADAVLDLQQQLRTRLLVPSAESEPKIAGFAGRGPIEKWVQAAAVKMALNWIKKSRRLAKVEVANEEKLLRGMVDWKDSPSGLASQDKIYLASKYGELVQSALRAAFRAMEPEQRNLLRLHYIDGLPLDQIGTILKVHKATVSRRIAAIRDQILLTVRSELRRQLHSSESVVDSLLAQLQSQLNLSLSALYRSET